MDTYKPTQLKKYKTKHVTHMVWNGHVKAQAGSSTQASTPKESQPEEAKPQKKIVCKSLNELFF